MQPGFLRETGLFYNRENNMKKFLIGGAAALFLLFAFVLTTCDMGYTESQTHAATFSVVEPVITVQPQSSASYTLGNNITALSVTATINEGNLSYQWYSFNDFSEYADGTGTAQTGATNDSFTPVLTTEGIYCFYVVVTGSNSSGTEKISVQSTPVIINMNDPVNAAYPEITVQPPDKLYEYTTGSLNIDLSVTASVGDGGDLSYQWYKSTTNNTTGGDAVGTGAALSDTLSAAGTYYYYVKVTNTKAVSGRGESETVSFAATVNAVKINATLNVDTATKYQYVRGFGGMHVLWDNIPDSNMNDFEVMFNPDRLGYNMLRIMIPPYDTDIRKTMDDVVKNRIFNGKREFYYDMVKLVNGYKGYVLASPWTPPAVWKSNESLNGGGHLIQSRWPHYANYLAEFARLMGEQGAPIYAISIQNEPNFLSSYDGCDWTPEEMRDFFKQVKFFTNGIKGFGGGKETSRVLQMNGETANAININDAALDDAGSRPYIDLIGRHNYGSTKAPNASSYTKAVAHPSFPGDPKEVWMTEHNLNTQGSYEMDSTWNYVWKCMNDIDISIRLNHENAFIWWNSKRFYSMLGCGNSGTNDGAILPRGYGLSHYAKYAKETWRCAVTAAAGSTLANGTTAVSASNFNNLHWNYDDTTAKAIACVSDDGKTITLVMYTPTAASGSGGYDMGNIKINLPAGFTIAEASGIRSSETFKQQKEMVKVFSGGSGNTAFVNLPRSQMLSVKFVKAD